MLDVIDPLLEKNLKIRIHIMENLSNSFYYKALYLGNNDKSIEIANNAVKLAEMLDK